MLLKYDQVRDTSSIVVLNSLNWMLSIYEHI